jgi:hypothetical protein
MTKTENGPSTEINISHSHLKPIEPAGISYYLAIAADGIIDISNEEYMYYKNLLDSKLNLERQQQISDD